MRAPIKRARLMAEINITPFTDVVLVLLIIFMITTPMIIQPGIKVKLPSAEQAESEQNRTITVMVDAQGNVFLENRQTDFGALKDALTARVSRNPDVPVVIKGDKSVRYDSVVRVLDTAKQAGARRIALAVELKTGEAAPAQ